MDGNAYEVGDHVGDYEVIEILGAGGFGQVYKVRNTLSDRIEALKVLLPSHIGDTALTERFMREIKVQAALQHPNIANLLGVQKQDNRILMFLEYIDGVTLDKALDRGRLSAGTTAAIGAQVLDALAYAHAAGVVHRDVKPANIMIQKNGTVKLMDFGIARFGSDRKLTSTGAAIGSLHYMSPEQINALPDLDGRTDLYSLGIVMYQSMTGTKPFDGPSDFSIMSGHLNMAPAPPITLDPTVPRAINDVVLCAVEKNRDHRFHTAQAFRQALDQAMGGRYPKVEVAMPVNGAAQGPDTVPTVPIGRSVTGPTAAMSTAPPIPPPIPTQYPMAPPPPHSGPVPVIYVNYKSPTVAAVFGFLVSWAGALYVGKTSMAFLLICAEIAVATASCVASFAPRRAHLSSGTMIELLFHCYTAWLCHKWATERNARAGAPQMPNYPRY